MLASIFFISYYFSCARSTEIAIVTIPPPPFEFDDFEPNIDAATMEVHYNGHWQAFANNYNAAITELALMPGFAYLSTLSVEDLLLRLDQIPETLRTNIRNNGGGFVNHQHYFSVVTSNFVPPSGTLLMAINADFGSFESFQNAFNNAAATQFGSGWAWLVVDCSAGGSLRVIQTANQDYPRIFNPLQYVILGIDVWEHAYYLMHQNIRGAYIELFQNVIDWDYVQTLFSEAQLKCAGPSPFGQVESLGLGELLAKLLSLDLDALGDLGSLFN